MSRSTVFCVLGLLACGSDEFSSILLPDAARESASESGDSDAPADATGDGMLPPETSTDAAVDAGADSYVCPTGVAACDDAIALLCARQKGCDAGCTNPASTQQCANKTICETACLADLKDASCTAVKQSVSPAFVSGNCAALW